MPLIGIFLLLISNGAALVGNPPAEILAFLGLGAYRKAFQQPRSRVGPQPHSMGASRVWLLPNPSGLNAHYSLQDLGNLFRQLKQTI